VAVIGAVAVLVSGSLTVMALGSRAAPDARSMAAMVNALCWGLPVVVCAWTWQRNVHAGRPGLCDVPQRFWQAQVLGLSLIPWMCGTAQVWGWWR
jgi:hypothetical protein